MAMFGKGQPTSLKSLEERRRRNQEMIANALMTSPVIGPGEAPAKAWQPALQMLTGQLQEKRLGKQESEARKKYQDTLARALDPNAQPQDTMAALAANPDTADYALKMKLAQMGMKADAGPSSVQEWQYYSQLSPKDQARFLEMKRQAYQIRDIGGVPSMAPQIPGLPVRPLSTLQQEATGKATIAGAEQAAKSGAQLESDKEKNLPKARLAMQNALSRADRVSSSIDAALPNVGYWTSGLIGATLDKIPGTSARDLRANIDTIRANIGFDELNAMRQSSPTGGALGQVSERELAFLQSVLSNLEQSQSPQQLRENLLKAKQEVKASWARVQEAFEQDYGRGSSRATSGQPKQSGGLTAEEQAELEQLRKELGQ